MCKIKKEPICEEVELLHANPQHAVVGFRDGQESTISITDLAPSSSGANLGSSRPLSKENPPSNNTPTDCPSPSTQPNTEEVLRNQPGDSSTNVINSEQVEPSPVNSPELRRSTRVRKPVDGYGLVHYE